MSIAAAGLRWKMSELHFKETEYGFEYGSAKITRLFSDEKKQWVTIGVETPKGLIQIYVTKTGKIRVHSKSGEWKEVEDE